ncbi:TetR/AcrR family transcriptional regulator [Spirillospora sp. NPDC048911]|uniref:TetR/AcrR family transcriptional regulator n=1 Tax=Spirillospora sp. NPDC048911 TaxID=3364527 RepID=UPI00371039D0
MGTREALVDAATGLLDEGGADAVTLREVGARVGVSHNAPYKHFAGKEALLAAVAARELARRSASLSALRDRPPGEALRAAMHDYVAWAQLHPNRFKLVFGTWTADAEGLGEAAHNAQTALVDLVTAAQQAGALPPGDPVRLASLIRSLAHGAADLAAAGHLAAGGKGHADPEDLIDDLFGYLRQASDTVTDPGTAKGGETR